MTISNKNDAVPGGKAAGGARTEEGHRLFREKQQCDSAEEGKEGAR